VPQRILCLIRTRKSDLKRRWSELLRAQPVRTAMAEPAILSYLMDDTLERFLAQLARRSSVRARRTQGLDELCRCGLNPLITYFRMGEISALELLPEAGEELETLRTILGEQWRALARREVEVLCGACVRTCASVERVSGTDASMASRSGSETGRFVSNASERCGQWAIFEQPDRVQPAR
jgi:hypothetical protein